MSETDLLRNKYLLEVLLSVGATVGILKPKMSDSRG
jgi:hypothetical protein